MWQAWVIFNEVFKLGKNAFFKNFFSAFGTLIQIASCHYIIIDNKLNIFELLNTQVQDLRDQKGDKFVGCKTLPLLLGDNICRWFTILMLIISLLLKKNLKPILIMVLCRVNLMLLSSFL
ncbi:hypothetical protein C2G38_2094200 [Gigaspora rosea]|uniref:Uncharacterized protein n=1 Tax=Gigaspora rosea TaxID=44941 RepID=A0A397V066_9GLOM|nr:hypothetical protein C2G38_2094200 [Gigaspora rosea]